MVTWSTMADKIMLIATREDLYSDLTSINDTFVNLSAKNFHVAQAKILRVNEIKTEFRSVYYKILLFNATGNISFFM